MALRIVPAPTFSAEVGISVPGQIEPERLRVTFKYMPAARFTAFLESTAGRADVDIVADVVSDIAGLQDEEGQPLPYSRGALEKLCAHYQPAALELYAAWLREHQQAKGKN